MCLDVVERLSLAAALYALLGCIHGCQRIYQRVPLHPLVPLVPIPPLLTLLTLPSAPPLLTQAAHAKVFSTWKQLFIVGLVFTVPIIAINIMTQTIPSVQMYDKDSIIYSV